jgi:hypothetical protein
MLMAYADGALSAFARAKIEAYLLSDPEARGRVEMFRATGAPLSRLYGRPISEPVPAYLKEFVLNYPLDETAPAATQLSGERRTGWFYAFGQKTRLFAGNLADWLERPAPAMRWQLAAASAALLALGVGAGALLSGGGATGDLVAFHDGHIYASGALAGVLEKELSGHEARIGGVRGEAVTMRASLTFKNKQHSYCREYEIATPSDGGFVGLGCRGGDGKWALELHVPSANPAKSGMKIAEGGVNTSLDATVDRMIDGDAFDIEQEAQAVRNGWK